MRIGSLAGAYAKARRTADEITRQREQDEAQRQMREIQQAAMLANLEEQGIVPGERRETIATELPEFGTIQDPARKAGKTVDTGITDEARYSPLGKSGFFQDRTRTKDAQRIAAERQRQQMLNRRRAVLQARGLNPDEIDVENDDIYESFAKYQVPKGPQAPTPGTPEYYAMKEREAQIAARYRQKPEPKPRVLPTSAVDKLVGLQDMRDQAQQVSEALSAAIGDSTNVTGRVAGVIRTPTWAKNLVGMGGEKGKDIRALIGGLYATVTKERAGAALSPGELNLLESYMPNENEDEATALVKANRFIRTLDKMMENKRKAYQKYGYNEGSADIVDDARIPYPEY